MRVVEIYGKPGCHLCEQARAELQKLQARLPFELSEIDVTLDPQLHQALRHDLPVVLVDGKRAFVHRVDLEGLERRLTESEES